MLFAARIYTARKGDDGPEEREAIERKRENKDEKF